jgi:tetratricopeptide (TPR) repeat protein
MPYIALEECYRAIEVASTYLPLHLRLAEIFAYQGKVEEAVSKYAAVADAYLMRHNPGKAILVYRRALLVAPMNVSIRERLIKLLIDHDEIDLALEECLALSEAYYRLARVDEALEKYEEALLLVPRTAVATDWEVRILHRVADLHVQRVRWKRAVAIYEKIRELSPGDEEARLRLVDLRYRLGQEDIALAELDSLIVHYGKEREFQKIIKTLRELVDSRPQDIPLRSRLSRIYVEAGMQQEAIAELDTLGELQLEAGLKRDTINTLRTIISLKPRHKEGYTQLLQELGED